MGLKIKVLEDSFNLVAPQGEALVTRFYERLFEKYPSVKPLFKGVPPKKQQKKLLASLVLVVSNLRKPEVLQKALHELGARHVGYGTEPAHYDAVNENLLAVLGEFAGKAWTPRVKRAWAEALEAIKTIMLEGAEQWEEGGQTMTQDEGRDAKLKVHELNEKIKAISKSQAMIEFNMDGTIITANDNFLNVLDYRLDEIQGKHHSMFVEASYRDSAAYQQFWAKLNQGTYEAGEYKRLGKGGKEVWIQASYNPIFDLDGKPFKVVKYATDVTERKTAEVEMVRLKTSLDNTSTNVMVCDRDYTIVYVNKATVNSLLPIEREIQKVLPSFAVNRVVGSNIDSYHKNPAHQRRLLDDPNILPYEAQIELGPLTLKLMVNAIRSDAGEYVGNVVEWQDITAEQKAQHEVERMIGAAVAGDLSERIDADSFEGFYKTLSSGINKMLEAVKVPLDEAGGVLRSLSEGDLRSQMTGSYQGTFGDIKENLNGAMSKLSDTLSSVRSAAEVVSSGVTEISHGNDDLSQRTSEQASSLEETSSSMEEMTSTVKQNADNAKQANQLAVAARDIASKGGEVTAKTIVAMAEVNKSSKKIVDIISVIDEIAFQTNLLALNAAVEAARAGEHGRGFAVVAAEVRNLAQRSATAAKEIKSLINESVQQVTDSSMLVNQSGKTLEEIVESVKRVTDVIGEISAASQEQSAGIDQVNKAIMQMDETTQQNAALVEQAASTSHGIKEQGAELLSQVDFFKFNVIEGEYERPARRASAEPHRAKAGSVAAPARRPAPASRRPVARPAASATHRSENGNAQRAKMDDFDEF